MQLLTFYFEFPNALISMKQNPFRPKPTLSNPYRLEKLIACPILDGSERLEKGFDPRSFLKTIPGIRFDSF